MYHACISKCTWMRLRWSCGKHATNAWCGMLQRLVSYQRSDRHRFHHTAENCNAWLSVVTGFSHSFRWYCSLSMQSFLSPGCFDISMDVVTQPLEKVCFQKIQFFWFLLLRFLAPTTKGSSTKKKQKKTLYWKLPVHDFQHSIFRNFSPTCGSNIGQSATLSTSDGDSGNRGDQLEGKSNCPSIWSFYVLVYTTGAVAPNRWELFTFPRTDTNWSVRSKRI